MTVATRFIPPLIVASLIALLFVAVLHAPHPAPVYGRVVAVRDGGSCCDAVITVRTSRGMPLGDVVVEASFRDGETVTRYEFHGAVLEADSTHTVIYLPGASLAWNGRELESFNPGKLQGATVKITPCQALREQQKNEVAIPGLVSLTIIATALWLTHDIYY